MAQETIELIEQRCTFCKRKAEYLFMRRRFFSTSWYFICEGHKYEFTKDWQRGRHEPKG